MQNKKILVTGGTGFIGTSLVKRLVKLGYSVRVMDNNLRGKSDRLKDVADKIELVEGDIRDRDQVFKACEGIHTVFHLAYLNGTEFFYSKPDLVLDIGVKGMVNIIDGSIHHKVKDFILASTSETYQTPPTVPTDESVPLSVPDPLNPRYSYGGGKIICELMAVNYGRKHFERTVIFRPHNVYGPDMGTEHVIPQFCMRMNDLVRKSSSETLDFPIQGTGAETRSFVFVEDFTDGLIVLLEKGENQNIYHIGTEEELSIRQLSEMIGQIYGKKLNVVPGALQKGGTVRRCPSIAKMRSLGYSPSTSLKEGLEKTAEFYKNL